MLLEQVRGVPSLSLPLPWPWMDPVADAGSHYRDKLSAGIIVAGWDKENGGTVYNIPLGGGLFKGPWAIGGELHLYWSGLWMRWEWVGRGALRGVDKVGSFVGELTWVEMRSSPPVDCSSREGRDAVEP